MLGSLTFEKLTSLLRKPSAGQHSAQWYAMLIRERHDAVVQQLSRRDRLCVGAGQEARRTSTFSSSASAEVCARMKRDWPGG